MAESGFPKAVEGVVATLVDIYRHQAQPKIVEILESASARFEQTDYDNWNGGTSIYALMLDVPVPLFASIEPRLSEIEKSICLKVGTICRDLSNDRVGSVTITPLTSKSKGVGPRPMPADAEVKHIWKEGFFRLFLSHVSAHKVAVANLKSELQVRGIWAFVAHEDIKPSLVWQNQIELALSSMHALAALLTPDFHLSNWTDQEVGFALGKGALVLPVRLGLDPYGFVGKVQGLSGSLEQPVRLAKLLFASLLDHASTHQNMRRGLASAFESAKCFADASELSKVIADVKDFSEDDKIVMRRACKDNDQVFKATGVVLPQRKCFLRFSGMPWAIGAGLTAKTGRQMNGRSGKADASFRGSERKQASHSTSSRIATGRLRPCSFLRTIDPLHPWPLAGGFHRQQVAREKDLL